MTQPLQRQRSNRLVTTAPDTSVRAALESHKPRITPVLFSGLGIQKISSKGTLVPRLLTLSDDLFTLFVSHHKVGGAESVSDRVRYKGYKAYAKVMGAVTGQPVQVNHDIRVIDVADILFVQAGFISSRKVEDAAHDLKKEAAKRNSKSKLDPEKVVSIFHNNGVTMDFMVESDEDRRAVLDAIGIITEAYHSSKTKVGREERLVRYAWYDTDFNKSFLLEQSEFLQLLGRINIYLKQEKAVKIFKSFVASKLPKRGGRIAGPRAQGINFEECLHILRKINSDLNEGTETADALFDDLFGEEKWVVTAEEFLRKFLQRKQRDKNATIEDVHKLFSRFNAVEVSGATRRVAEDGEPDREAIDRTVWREYLMSRSNDVYDPGRRELDFSTLNRPLPEYWINSSHNTYLTGDQLKSLSSVEMYVLAMQRCVRLHVVRKSISSRLHCLWAFFLQRGCKCLELDCWDDDDSGEPIVYHGYTLTSKIPFQAIISCVKGYVEANPDTLPIILSLENHCSHPFQMRMAIILNNTLGDRLYKLPESSGGPLPSPMDLVGKVVLKGKRPPEYDDDTLTELGSIDDLDIADEEALVESASFQSENSKSSSRKRDKVKESLSRISEIRKEAEKAPLPKIVPQLANLTLFNGAKYKDFDASVALPLTDMHSFSESKMEKLYKNPDNVQKWKRYNVDHMSRIYPAGSRVDSSNYNPVVPWSSGCQLVALNFQSDDSDTTINDGRFRENGGCGYVLKPPSVFPDKEPSSGGKILRIKVLSGSCLPKPYGESVGEVIDPYVVIRVHDVRKSKKMRESVASRSSTANQSTSTDSGDDDMLETTERKTDSVRDNGFCPQWKDAERFSFPVNSDVAMVEFIVMDSNRGFIDEIMCKTAVPVSCLRQGFRSLQFYDQCSSQHGPFGMARILLDVDINYVV